jgi:hypothetical protein
MKQTTVSILVQLYNWLLRLYPSDCRVEFGDEMRVVFIARVLEAEKNRLASNTARILREICDWPGVVWREYLCAQKGYKHAR